MAVNTGISFKVYLNHGGNLEVKRFYIDSDVVTSFLFLREKLINLFPVLKEKTFKITWKDVDDDDISISNDEDFITALTEMDNVKVLHVSILSVKSCAEKEMTLNIICDVCDSLITGTRYKCLECQDYDLCSVCEGEGNHSEHLTLRIPKCYALHLIRFDRKMILNAIKALKRGGYASHGSRHGGGHKYTRGMKHGQEFVDRDKSERCQSKCPFTANDAFNLTELMNIGKEVACAHLNPALDALNNTTEKTQKATAEGPAALADIIKNAIDTFFGKISQSENSTTPENNPGNQNNTFAATSNEGTQKPTTASQPPPASQKEPQSDAAQDMEWTLVNNNQEQTNNAQTTPILPPQDPRLMRGLAQLHEMGFSNENNFLTALMTSHDYNVNEVVKAILQLK